MKNPEITNTRKDKKNKVNQKQKKLLRHKTNKKKKEIAAPLNCNLIRLSLILNQFNQMIHPYKRC